MTGSVKEMEAKLDRLRDKRADLQKEHKGLVARQQKLQTKASRSLAGVTVGKLLGQAEEQAELRVKAEGLQVAIHELERRLAECQEAIEQTEDAIEWAAAEEMKKRADEIFLEAVEEVGPLLELARELEDLTEKYMDVGVRLAAKKGQGQKMAELSRVRGWRSHVSAIRRVGDYLKAD